MNQENSNVEDINIPQIMERLSMSCIATFEESSLSFAIDFHPVQEWSWL